MENNLSKSVKFLCKQQGITMRELAEKMEIAPESLSRAINGNPQLSTIKKIAECLNVEVMDLFNPAIGDEKLLPLVKFQDANLPQYTNTDIEEINSIKVINNELVAMVRFRNQTLATTDLNTLIEFINTIIKLKQATENEDVEEV
ncbi:MAG: helix-turn-helix domain-containing protein [Prevotella sp.]